MRSSDCGVASIVTGTRKAWSGARRCDRSTANFHSSLEYPSMRACVLAEMMGMKSAHDLICLRIAESHTSLPRSSL